jgi:hypothetical protein
MSYIRSTSNPEALYIYEGGHGVEVIAGPRTVFTADVEQFRRLMVKAKRDLYVETVFEVGDLKLEETKSFKWKLSKKGEGSVTMWMTTLVYILYLNDWRRGH